MRLLYLAVLAFWLTGCSVLMALEGDTPRDYSTLTMGSSRQQILDNYGPPLSSVAKNGKTVDTYEFEEGDESSPERVPFHVMADMMSFGAWELIATPYEWFQGNEVTYVVEYGMDETVTLVSPTPPKPPMTPYSAIMSYPSPSTISSPKPTAVSIPRSEVDQVPFISPRLRRRSHAIVIGIEKYREQVHDASYAAHDARIMANYLTQALGYSEENVAVLLNDRATRADLHKYFESWLPNRVEPNDSVFIYFSGHGAPNIKTGEAYLVPYDGDPLYIDKTGYSLTSLYEYLNQLPAKEVVVVLDSCFSGAGGRSVIVKGMRPIMLSVENPLLAQGNTIVLGASAGDQVSNTYEKKGHGLLTYFFLKGLQGEGDQNKDGVIELAELYTYLKPQVERTARREFNTDQVPQLLGSPDALSKEVRLLEGDSI